MSDQRTATAWFELIDSWDASGLSGAAWCREHGIVYHQFLYWKGRRSVCRAVDNGLAEAPVHTSFCEVVADKALTAEIGGVRFELERGFDPVVFREAVAALREA